MKLIHTNIFNFEQFIYEFAMRKYYFNIDTNIELFQPNLFIYG